MSSSSFKKFQALHRADKLFLLPNSWDVKSAQVLEEAKYPAAGTSSAAVANVLGYQDGEGMPLEDYLFVIKRILASINIPLTVDFEMGYGKTRDEVYANIMKLVDLGVAGINIEDSIIESGKRSLKDAVEFGGMIEYVKKKIQAKNEDIFINLRSDTYLLNLGNKQEETRRRLSIYNDSGADSIFLPFITNEDDITDAVKHAEVPISVMCINGLPDFDTLNKLGVKRVSMGPFLFKKIYGSINGVMKTIESDKDFSSVL